MDSKCDSDRPSRSGNPDCDTPVCRGKRPEDHLGIMCECHFHPKCRYKPEGDGRPVKGKRKPKELNYAISRYCFEFLRDLEKKHYPDLVRRRAAEFAEDVRHYSRLIELT